MVERCGIPSDRGVARGTVCCSKGGAGCRVHWIVRALPSGQMAAGISAVRRGNGQRIVVVDVAQRACHAGVSVGQRESGRIVIKNSSRPRSNRVAGRAGRGSRRETSRDVVRNVTTNRCGALECCRVASITVRRIQRVIVVHMARRAGGRRW